MLNNNLAKFKKLHKKKKNQILYTSIETNGKIEIENLINKKEK